MITDTLVSSYLSIRLTYTSTHAHDTNYHHHGSFFQILVHLIVRASKAAVTDPVHNVHAVRVFVVL